MQELLNGNGDPERVELSQLDQLIHVTAHSEGLLLDHLGEVMLGSLSHEDSGSVGASIFFQHKGDSFACYATVELPERLASQPLPNICGLLQSLASDGKVLPWKENIYFTPICYNTYNFIGLTHRIDGSVEPIIHINTKGSYAKPADTVDEPDTLKYGDYPVDEVVMRLGETISHITNELHQMNGSRNSARLDITLPYFSPTEAAIASSEIVPACRPEHINFPDFEDFGGLDQEIIALREAALDRFSPDLLGKYGLKPSNGIILQGPGGVGKTGLVQALAKKMRVNYHEVRGTEIRDPYIGVSERQLRQTFDACAATNERTILFFDEADGLFSNNAGGNEGSTRSLVAELKAILGNMNRYPNLLVIVAANSLANFDPALLRPGRFDTVIKIGLPSEAARAEIFNKYLYKHAGHFAVMTIDNIDDSIITRTLAERAANFTGNDIESVITGLLRQKMRRELARGSEPPKITQAEILEAIDRHRQTRPSDI